MPVDRKAPMHIVYYTKDFHRQCRHNLMRFERSVAAWCFFVFVFFNFLSTEARHATSAPSER